MEKNLILLVENYPFGFGEPFLEDEISTLSVKFHHIYIITTNLPYNLLKESLFNLPKNVTVHIFTNHTNKIKSLIQLINPIFWREIIDVIIVLKRLPRIIFIKVALIALQNGYNIKKFIDKIIESEKGSWYLYSYWCNNAALGIALTANKDAKRFSRMHGSDLYFERQSANYLPFRRLIFNQLDRVFAISENGRQYILEKLPYVATQKITLSRLGVRNNYSISDELENHCSLVILSVSNIIPVKRVWLIVDALSNLLSIPIHWIHIGSGEQMKSIEQKAEKLLSGSKITFEFKGQMKKQDVLNEMRCFGCKLFINTSLSEGIPVSIMEAMSYGIPVLATAVGGTPEIVNNTNGYLISSNPDPHEIASKILDFYNLPLEKKNQKRLAAFNTWNEKYNAERNYIDFVNQILAL